MENSRMKTNEIRCGCGKLFFIKTPEGFEYKCPRCKKIHMISYEELLTEYHNKRKS